MWCQSNLLLHSLHELFPLLGNLPLLVAIGGPVKPGNPGNPDNRDNPDNPAEGNTPKILEVVPNGPKWFLCMKMKGKLAPGSPDNSPTTLRQLSVDSPTTL